MQHACVRTQNAWIDIDLPAQGAEVTPGVCWGTVQAFPTPAYWAYQVLARRITGTMVRYRLGSTLREEVGACLLGGHGISARMGLLAFEHLKHRGVFLHGPPSAHQLHAWLSEPLVIGDRKVRYRFAAQKARYLAAALSKLVTDPAPDSSGRALRDWLLDIPGVGYKTASWIARNWMDADDVAILDIHVRRAGILGGFLDPHLTVEHHYLELERQFIKFSRGLGVRTSELDAVIWLEMSQSRATVARMLRTGSREAPRESGVSHTAPAKHGESHALQLALASQ